MKIQIEISKDTKQATLTIGERELVYSQNPDGGWCYRDEDMTSDEEDTTLAGLLAHKIAWDVFDNVLNNDTIEEIFEEGIGVWDKLDDTDTRILYRALS